MRSYTLGYDDADRLTAARFAAFNGSSWATEVDDYSVEGVQYDLNGNIKHLQRKARLHSVGQQIIDKLRYAYNGNQLAKVTDESSSANKEIGFNDGINLATEYLYDANGNLKEDKNKGLTYGYSRSLNLLTTVTTSGGTSLSYTYDGQGNRLQKQVGTKITYYLKGYVYEKTSTLQLKQAPMPEGMARYNGSSFQYEYFISDHMGNVRVSFVNEAGVARVVQENGYYPFGMQMPGAMTYHVGPDPNKRLFNEGSEWQDDLDGLLPQTYSTPLREYDPVLGRFQGVDVLALAYAGHNPYQFGLNNPLKYNDPTGAKAAGPGYTGPGSGHHWTDGIGNSDWSLWGGSETFRTNLSAQKAGAAIHYSGGQWRTMNGNDPVESNGSSIGYYTRTSSSGVQPIQGLSFAMNIAFNSPGTISEQSKFVSLYDIAQNGGGDFSSFLSIAGDISTKGGMAVTSADLYAGELLKRAGRRAAYQAATTFDEVGAVVKIGPFAARTTTLSKVGSTMTAVGKVVGLAGVGISGLQYLNGDISGLEASFDSAMGLIGIFGGPVGAGVSLVYFGGKLGYEYFSGDTLFEKPGK